MPFTIVDGQVTIKDGDGNVAQMGKDGRLHVTTQSPQDVDGYTQFTQTEYQAIDGYHHYANTYVIPNGKELIITNFHMSASGGQNSAGIYYVPDGVYDTETIGNDLIRGSFFGMEPVEYQIDRSYTGDGTAAIVLVLRRRSKGKEWIGGDWNGFIED